MSLRSRTPLLALSALILAVILAPAAAHASDVVHAGTDLWKTTQGLSYSDFSTNPIPAGFFCDGSPVFDGKLQFEGKKLPAEPAEALEGADTIVHRLEEATFDADGEARTAIRLLALWLESPEPVDVGCEQLYHVDVVLDGEQPTTEMKIVRNTPNGGIYVAPLALNVKVRFTPANGELAERKEVFRHVELGSGSLSIWSEQAFLDDQPLAQVDTDGDGEVDTLVPPRGNFIAGVAPAALQTTTRSQLCPYTSCHCAEGSSDPWEDPTGCEDDHLHCTEVWVDCCELERRGISTNTAFQEQSFTEKEATISPCSTSTSPSASF